MRYIYTKLLLWFYFFSFVLALSNRHGRKEGMKFEARAAAVVDLLDENSADGWGAVWIRNKRRRRGNMTEIPLNKTICLIKWFHSIQFCYQIEWSKWYWIESLVTILNVYYYLNELVPSYKIKYFFLKNLDCISIKLTKSDIDLIFKICRIEFFSLTNRTGYRVIRSKFD